ncbi:hypothetical protein MMC25_002711 [Agyrium rufum]|nr:hypothetical protein [Agyrium rufum]
MAPTGSILRLQSRQCWRCAQRSFSSSARRAASTHDVRIVEVGPRDGLQNEKNSIPLSTKLELIRRLAQTGVRDIEAGSFVAPKWVPQMANSADILNQLLGHPPQAPHDIRYNFLVPNMKGLQNYLKAANPSGAETGEKDAPPTPPQTPEPAEEDPPASNTSTQDPNEMPSNTSGVNDPVQPADQRPDSKSSATSATSAAKSSPPTVSTEISIFAAATESFSKANTNCSIQESLARFREIISLAKSHDIRVRGYVSVALGCPYEGPNVSPVKVAEITRSLLEMGTDEVSVADTTGMGTASKTQELLKALFAAGISSHDIALHFHDTYGQALVNTVVGLENGIRTFDSSVGGLGGCPYSKGATGNVATEDLVHCLHSFGASTGVDLEKMAEIGEWISQELGRSNESRAGKAILARMRS